MKKVLFSAALLLSGATAFAQTTTDVANLKVNLADIKTIEVLTKSVAINIATGDDYLNGAGATGVSITKPAHLKVISRGGFKVLVTAASNLTGPTAGQDISKGNIYISVLGHNSLSPAAVAATELTGLVKAVDHNLGTAPTAAIITTALLGGGTAGTTFDVQYTMKNQANLANLPAGDYATTVTYTIALP